MVGPSLERVSHASHAPITTATMGSSHIADTRRDRRVDAWTRPCSLVAPLIIQSSKLAPTRSFVQRKRVYTLADGLDHAIPARPSRSAPSSSGESLQRVKIACIAV